MSTSTADKGFDKIKTPTGFEPRSGHLLDAGTGEDNVDARRSLALSANNMEPARSHFSSPQLPVGTPVRVRTAFGSWAGGFEIAGYRDGVYAVRRVSDGYVLPVEFSGDALTPTTMRPA